ncbi:MAG: hypothetical protein LWY06_10570 [Firmicutes bacterium]|nr:hypothetical protein [Bacillota bacterium]
MIINIYPLVVKSTGKVPGSEYLAMVELTASGVRVECYDAILKEKLRSLFSSPIVKKTPSSTKSGVFTHNEEVIQPFTEDFFREILFMLYPYNLHGIIKE